MGRRGTAHLVEIDPSGLRWAKSSASNTSSGSNCVEIALVRDLAVLRCSRNRARHLTVPAGGLASLVNLVTQRQR